MSCTGNGYLTGNALVAFPFEDDQCLNWNASIPRSSAQIALQKCFVDAAIHLSSVSIPSGGWPSIGHFSVSGTTLSFTVSACGHDVRMSVAASITLFPIVSGVAPWGSYVLVLSSECIREFCESGFTPPATGSSSPSWRDGDYWLRLCAKCITMRPMGISSIRVYDGVGEKSEGPHFVLTGDIAFLPGNNMLLSEPNDTNGISLNASPGAGMGVVPCECTGGPSKASPFMSPDGHTRFFNDTCYDIEPSIETIGSVRIGKIKLHAKCTACCTCSMYESIVNERLAPLAAVIRQAKSDVSELLSTYESAVKRFNKRLEKPTMDDVSVSISGMSVGSNLGSKLSDTGVKGKMGRCAFTAVIRNGSYSTLSASLYTLSGTDNIVEVSAAWSDESGDPKSLSGDTARSVIGKTFTICPGRSLVITFVSTKNDLVGSVRTGGYVGSISVGLSYRSPSGASGSLGVVSKSVEV